MNKKEWIELQGSKINVASLFDNLSRMCSMAGEQATQCNSIDELSEIAKLYGQHLFASGANISTLKLPNVFTDPAPSESQDGLMIESPGFSCRSR